MKASPTINNCIITENIGEFVQGGGIYCHDSSPIISNCIISKNEISAPEAAYGGGIFCRGVTSAPIITNCHIIYNKVSSNLFEFGGGIYCESGSLFIKNCIIWGNSPHQIYNESGNIDITYSDIQWGYWQGEGNIDEDPRFYPFPIRGFEYFLRKISPCIDTGDPSIEDRLFDWHPKWPDWYPNGARSDMGAYGGPGNIGWVK